MTPKLTRQIAEFSPEIQRGTSARRRAMRRPRGNSKTIDALDGLDSSWLVAPEDLTMCQNVGHGAFGVVSKCEARSLPGIELAAKRFPSTLRLSDVNLVRKEVAAWRQLDDHNVLRVSTRASWCLL